MGMSFAVEPADLRFTIVQSKEEEIDIDAGYFNYELIYGGTDGESITITYREFTPNDLAKPAFNENLVYDRKQKTIRFRDTVINVHSATNEKIEFTVISDNLKK